jgi:two-component system LytT family response regulator
MITALLVDDEPLALERMASLLEDFETVEVIGTARSVDDAERFLRGRVPDVVFLDINMPGRLGIDLVASIPPGTKVVFVTAHEGHAIDAFRHGAVDYVLKPFDRDRLFVTIERLEQLIERDEPAPPSTASRQAAGATDEEAGEASADTADTVTLTGSRGRGVDVVSHADIVWIEAIKNYSRVLTRGRPPRLIRRTMAEWEQSLPTGTFVRISRSLIVQRSAIRATQWQSRDQTLLFFKDVDAPLPLGRTAAARLKELLQAE